MPENNQVKGLIINFIQQMIWKAFEICPPESVWVKMVTARISFNGRQNQIQLIPKCRKNPLRDLRIMQGDVSDIVGEFWMTDNLHRLGATTLLPKLFLRQPFHPAGFQILKTLYRLFIRDVMGLGIQIFEERRNQLSTV